MTEPEFIHNMREHYQRTQMSIFWQIILVLIPLITFLAGGFLLNYFFLNVLVPRYYFFWELNCYRGLNMLPPFFSLFIIFASLCLIFIIFMFFYTILLHYTNLKKATVIYMLVVSLGPIALFVSLFII